MRTFFANHEKKRRRKEPKRQETATNESISYQAYHAKSAKAAKSILLLYLVEAIVPSEVGVKCDVAFNSIRSPSKGGERTLAGRLVQEMRGLTSMAWDDKYAR